MIFYQIKTTTQNQGSDPFCDPNKMALFLIKITRLNILLTIKKIKKTSKKKKLKKKSLS